MKVTAEVNEIENRKRVEKVSETESWFLRTLIKLINFICSNQEKQEREIQITNTRNESAAITTDLMDSKRIL